MLKLLPHLSFILLAALAVLGDRAQHSSSWRVFAVGLAIEITLVLRQRFQKEPRLKTAYGDISAVLLLALALWQLLTANLNVADKMLFPPPETVFALFAKELPDMLKGLASSMVLLLSGYFLALATAVPIGLYAGWKRRLHEAINPFAKVLGPIPPIVYIPYAIALLPSFRAASIFVIFLGAFWPLLINTLNGVFNIPSTLLDAARALNLKERTILFRVILPGAMPSICAGATLALVFSFLLLAAAELIGATSGLGWYVKNFSDFGDYQRVIVGIIFMGLVVTVVTFITDRIEKRLLRWRD